MIFRSQSNHANHNITEAVPGPGYSRDVLRYASNTTIKHANHYVIEAVPGPVYLRVVFRYVSMLVLSTRRLCFGMLARWSCLLAGCVSVC